MWSVLLLMRRRRRGSHGPRGPGSGSEVLGADTLEELPELLDLLLLVVALEDDPSLVEHSVVGEDRYGLLVTHRQGDGVGGPGRDPVPAAVENHLKLGEERAF